jgi:hypothetical protein
MSEDEGFVGRWSRRKQEAAKRPSDEVAANKAAPEQVPVESAEEAEPEFDISTLPPIESIVAGTDIRSFLSAGVPAHLTRAALRAAWSADPAIRDYIGLSENSWDFNAAGSMHGFGPIDPSLDIEKMVAEMFGQVKNVAKEAERVLGDKTDSVSTLPQAPQAEEPPIPASVRRSFAPTESVRNSNSRTIDQNLIEPGDKTAQIEAAPQRDEEQEAEMPMLPRRHGSALPS